MLYIELVRRGLSQGTDNVLKVYFVELSCTTWKRPIPAHQPPTVSRRSPLGNTPVYLTSRILACIADHSTFGHIMKFIDITYTNMRSQYCKSQLLEFVHFFQYYLIQLFLHGNPDSEKEALSF
jgi:hypothetical protein